MTEAAQVVITEEITTYVESNSATGDVNVTIAPAAESVTVIISSTGDRGPAGLNGNSGTGIDRIADVPLSGHRAVRATSEHGVDYCDANTESHRDLLLGISNNAGTTGDTITVVVSGEVHEPSWTWVVGGAIFCGPNGTLTQTFDPTWAWSRVLGFATSSTDIIVEIRDPIDLA